MSETTTTAALSGPRRRRSRATRALGYAIAVIVNSVLIYLVNVAPGWEAVPFLSAGTVQVVPLFNAALAVGIAGNSVNIVVDRRWMRAVTEILSSCVSLVFIVATWRVFPFTFPAAVIRLDSDHASGAGLRGSQLRGQCHRAARRTGS